MCVGRALWLSGWWCRVYDAVREVLKAWGSVHDSHTRLALPLCVYVSTVCTCCISKKGLYLYLPYLSLQTLHSTVCICCIRNRACLYLPYLSLWALHSKSFCSSSLIDASELIFPLLPRPLSPPRYLHPEELELLKPTMVPSSAAAKAAAAATGDDDDDEDTKAGGEGTEVPLVPSSRKEASVRRRELLAYLREPLREACATDAPMLMRSKCAGSVVLLEAIRVRLLSFSARVSLVVCGYGVVVKGGSPCVFVLCCCAKGCGGRMLFVVKERSLCMCFGCLLFTSAMMYGGCVS